MSWDEPAGALLRPGWPEALPCSTLILPVPKVRDIARHVINHGSKVQVNPTSCEPKVSRLDDCLFVEFALVNNAAFYYYLCL